MSFYEAGFETLFRNALNGMNIFPFELTEQMYGIRNPRPFDHDTVTTQQPNTNTVCTVFGTGIKNAAGMSYTGAKDVYYTRLDLGVLFKGVPIRWDNQNDNTNEFAHWVANNFNIPMRPEDLVYQEMDPENNNSYVEIVAHPDSKWFIGSCMVYYTVGTPNIGQLIPPDWVSGIHQMLDPADANYVLTYNHDYTGFSEPILAAVKAPNAPNRTRAWYILMGNPNVQWRAQMATYVITGEENVVAAGGRHGFNNLFQLPALNIWAHFND